jgi:hypothetical protein
VKCGKNEEKERREGIEEGNGEGWVMRGNVTLWGAEPRILVDAQGPTRLSCERLVNFVTETTEHCFENSFSSR